MKKLLFLSLALSVVSSLTYAPTRMSAVAADEDTSATSTAEVGKAAPDFTLPDQDGKSRNLSDYKGKFVVLEWVNFGCPFVRKHYNSKNMQSLQQQYTKKGVIWLSICSSAPEKQGYFKGDELKQQIKTHDSHATAYLSDEDGKVGRQYGAKTTPDMFVIDKAGTIVYAGAIDDKPTPDVADVKSAKNYVKAALDEAMKGKKIAVVSSKSYGCSVKYAN